MERLGMEEDVPIEHGLINRAIENAQKKVEGHNFDIRKNLLEYDDVMNQQRKTIYSLRRQVLEGRYAPEPTEAEKDRGITSTDAPLPTESGKHTVASLSSMVRPILARMCDALGESRAPDPATPGNFIVTTVPVNASHLRSLIYREWGAYPDTKGIVEDRTATLDRLAGEVASSMIQQRERLLDLSEEMIQSIVDEHCPPNSHAEDWDLEVLSAAVKQRFNFEPAIDAQGGLERETLAESLWSEVEKVLEAREMEYPLSVLLHYARLFYLEEIDERWIEHLKSMEALREGIHLRGYGQKDPKQEYKKEGFVIFGEMMDNIGRNVCEKLFHMQLQRADAPAPVAAGAPPPSKPPTSVPMTAAPRARKTIESGGGAEPQARASNGGGNGGGNGTEPQAKPVRRNEPKVGRNDPCPCGSGKKYKKCHGDVATT
jgi:preprotein translocase subunit SecA